MSATSTACSWLHHEAWLDRRIGLQQQFENDAEQDGDSIFGCVMISFSVRSQFQQNFQQLNERMHQVQLTTAHYQQTTPVVQTQLRETYISSNGNEIERQCMQFNSLWQRWSDESWGIFQHYTGQHASLTVSNFPPRMHWSTAELHIEVYHLLKIHRTHAFITSRRQCYCSVLYI